MISPDKTAGMTSHPPFRVEPDFKEEGHHYWTFSLVNLLPAKMSSVSQQADENVHARNKVVAVPVSDIIGQLT